MPGAGGTQRLPRLLGVEAALNLIVSGATVASEKLRGTPLFDDFGAGDLLERALAFARRALAEQLPRRRVRDLKLEMPNAESFFQFARNMVKGAAGPYPAPLACVEAVAAAVELPFEAGLKRERELFTTLMLSPESAALRHVFQAERAASRVLGVPEDTPVRPIAKVGVIGAGTMGGGITMSFINAGLPVVMLETKQDALDRGLATIRRNYQGALRKGTLTEASLAQRLALITPTLDYASLRDVDLVIEAVFENMDVKRQVFETLDGVVQQGAILASNTSALNLDDIAKFTRRPQDVIGLHFFSPANVMRLLEVVRGAKTAKDVLATVMRLSKTIGKVAVVSGVCDGFIGNRMLARYGAAAHDLIMAGALPQQVDAALQEFGMAMGPFRVGDLAGLDIGWALRKRRAAEFPDRDFSNVADALCEAGRFGQKTGAGWYRYEAGSRNPDTGPQGDGHHRAIPPAKRHHAARRGRPGDRRALHLCADQRRRPHHRGRHRAAILRHRHRVPEWLRFSGLPRRTHVLCRPGRDCTTSSARSSGSRHNPKAMQRSGRRRRCSPGWLIKARLSADSKDQPK